MFPKCQNVNICYGYHNIKNLTVDVNEWLFLWLEEVIDEM